MPPTALSRSPLTPPLLRHVKRWQRLLTAKLLQQNPDASPETIDRATRELLLTLVCVALCEQLQLLPTGSLRGLIRSTEFVEAIASLPLPFGIFWQTLIPDRSQLAQLRVSSTTLKSFFSEFEKYGRTIPLSIAALGEVYECCLGQTGVSIDVTSNNVRSRRTTKKIGGIYYTPAALVEDIVQQTIECYQQTYQTFPTSILDPTCGGGAFLLHIYQRLCQSLTDDGGDLEALLNTLYGVDIDAQAVAVTRCALMLAFTQSGGANWQRSHAIVHQTIRCGNTLIDGDHSVDHSTATANLIPFDWHMAFPDVMSQGGFDIVVGNPPYMDSEQMAIALPHWRQYCIKHYQTASGNWDVFCVFIERALMLCKPGGFVGLVVPNKLASANYAAATRSLLIHQSQLLTIHDYSHVGLFKASVYPLVFVTRNVSPNQLSNVQYEVMQLHSSIASSSTICLQDFNVQTHYTFTHTEHPEQTDRPWTIATHSTHTKLFAQLEQFPPLAEVASVTGAATVAEAYWLKPFVQEASDNFGSNCYQFINSGTIDRYQILWGTKPLRYLGDRYQRPIVERSHLNQLPAARRQQAQQPKIVVAGLTQQLECVLDVEGSYLAGKSTAIVRSSLDLRYLLALLNSRLLSAYMLNQFGGNCLQGGYLRIGPPQLRQLPIRLINEHNESDRQLYSTILKQVDRLLALSSQLTCTSLERDRQLLQLQFAAIDEAIDRTVFTLYGLSDEDRCRLG